MNDEKNWNGSTLVAFLAGGLIGAGLALLYAPVSGKEAREKMSDLAEDLKQRAQGWTGDMRSRVETFMDREKSAMKEAFDAGREAMAREKAKFEGGVGGGGVSPE